MPSPYLSDPDYVKQCQSMFENDSMQEEEANSEIYIETLNDDMETVRNSNNEEIDIYHDKRTTAEQIANELDEKVKNYVNSNKDFRDQAIASIQRLMQMNGLTLLGYPDWRHYFRDRLKDSGYSEKSFYVWVKAATFAEQNGIQFTPENSEPLRVIAQVKIDDQDLVWDRAISKSGSDIPLASDIREAITEIKKERKAESNSIALEQEASDSQSNIKESDKSELDFSVYSKMELNQIKKVQDAANARIRAIDDDPFGLELMDKETLQKLAAYLMQRIQQQSGGQA